MLTEFKKTLNLLGIQRLRLSLIVISIMVTMGMISFHMSSRTYFPQIMESFGNTESVASRSKMHNSSQVKTMVAEFQHPLSNKKEHTQSNNVKMSFSGLKSFRTVQNKARIVPKAQNMSSEREKVLPTMKHDSTNSMNESVTAASNMMSDSTARTASSTIGPDTVSSTSSSAHSGHFTSKYQVRSSDRIESYQRNGVDGIQNQGSPTVKERVPTKVRPLSPRRTVVLAPVDFSGTKNYYDADWSKLTKLNSCMRIRRLKPPDQVLFHELAEKDPYRSRLLKIQESCEQHRDPFSSFIDISRMTRDDKHRTIMCVIPKAACTTWKSALFYLLGRSTLEGAYHVDPRRLVLAVGQVKTLARLRGEDIVDRLNNFTKFTVTRHPFQRLVSAYRDKFQGGDTPYALSRGRTIAQRVLASYLKGQTVSYARKTGKVNIIYQIKNLGVFKNLPLNDQAKVLDIAKRGATGNITFEEFLKFEIAKGAYRSRNFDIHWRPQYFLCNPCAINYDFVIRFEDLENESNMVLNYLQRNEPEETKIYFPGGKPAAVTDTVAQKFFSTISPELRETVRKVYQKDFEYFNYDPDIF